MNGDDMRRTKFGSFGGPIDHHFERMKGGIKNLQKLLNKLDELIGERQMVEIYMLSMDILSIVNAVAQDAFEVIENPENEEQKKIAEDAIKWTEGIGKLTERNINEMVHHIEDNLM